MYWSEWSPANHIKKAAMNSSNQKVIVVNTGNAIGLAVDFEMRRLFWAETKTSTVMSSDLRGLNKKVIVQKLNGVPIGLTLHRDFVYWSNISHSM